MGYHYNKFNGGIFFKIQTHACMRTHTHTNFQTRSINLKEICRSTTKVSSPTFCHSLITHNCFLIGGKFLFFDKSWTEKISIEVSFCFLFFLCMSLFNISLVKDKEETWFVCHWCKLIPNYCWKTYNIHMNAYFHYDMLSNLNVIQNSKSHDY